jgi:uncharacterized protein (DUF58 family)
MSVSEERDPKSYLDPKTLDTIGSLELRARLVVEGFVSGMHESPYRGFSVEFAQHREYVPGDDIRFVDWKVYAKSDRIYIKEFEEETNLRAWLILDQSESMTYGSSRAKFDYAATAVASLAYLIQQQSDAVGLALFDEGVMSQLPPSNSRAQLNSVLKMLSQAKPTGKTKVGKVLHALADRLASRGLVVIASDLFDDVEEILSGLRHLRHRGHDLIVLHCLDRDEVDFPFERMTLFEGLEALPQLLVDPKSLREAYLKEVGDFEAKVRRGCLAQQVDYQRVVTDQSLDVVLTTYLARRAHLRKALRRR